MLPRRCDFCQKSISCQNYKIKYKLSVFDTILLQIVVESNLDIKSKPLKVEAYLGVCFFCTTDLGKDVSRIIRWIGAGALCGHRYILYVECQTGNATVTRQNPSNGYLQGLNWLQNVVSHGVYNI